MLGWGCVTAKQVGSIVRQQEPLISLCSHFSMTSVSGMFVPKHWASL
jgi:hypothetical protein